MQTGILTFHRALNYGALLQAFALRTKISALGVGAEVIDYRNKTIEDLYAYPCFSEQDGLRNKVKYIIQHRAEITRRQRFEDFRNSYLLGEGSSPYTRDNLAEVCQRFDKVFVGSDQVWNPEGTGFDTTYLLDFLKASQKYSYAASFGVSRLEETYRNRFSELLGDFKMRSVRETQGKEILKELGLSAEVNIDPVYLLSKDEWNTKFDLADGEKSPYALVYSFNVTQAQIKMAEECRKKGLKIIFIGNPISNVMKMPCKYIRDAGPETFLKLFYNASFVITNSFHGASFSIIFNRPAAIEYLGNNVNSRIENLLAAFNIKDRLLTGETVCSRLIEETPDWADINSKILTFREVSETYLRKCLE